MKDDKEIDREVNQYLLANERIGWLKEELELNKRKIQKNTKRITKLQRMIREKKRVIKILEDFDKEMDEEFEKLY